jgi:hypothetical protein
MLFYDAKQQLKYKTIGVQLITYAQQILAGVLYFTQARFIICVVWEQSPLF